MMSLDNVIDTTEKLASKINMVKENINLSITKNGGSISEKLSFVPGEIENLTTQRSLIAKSSFQNMEISIPSSRVANINIPLRLNFNPELIIFKIQSKTDRAETFIDETSMWSKIKTNTVTNGRYNEIETIDILGLDKDFLKLRIKFHNGGEKLPIRIKWIAIG